VSTFVKTAHNSEDGKFKRFTKEREAARNEVERVFGVLQSQWAIVRLPTRIWSTGSMWEVMTTCVIMYNMIVEDERGDNIYDQG
jgi:hypothetical protein